MNRVLTVTLALFLAAVPIEAQMRVARPMGGGRMSAGPRVGFGVHAGGHGSGFRGGFSSNRIAVRTGGFGFVRPGFRGRYYSGFRTYPRFRAYSRVRAYPYAYFGYYPSPYSSGYYGASYYGAGYPYYGVNSYVADDPAAEDEAVAHQQLNEQVGELTAELRDLRDENEALREEAQQKSTDKPKKQKEVTPPAPVAQKTTDADPATVIVYKDGHQREVRSFVIVGKTLWILSEQRAQKIPLAELDLDATEKANAERGIDFLMPSTK